MLYLFFAKKRKVGAFDFLKHPNIHYRAFLYLYRIRGARYLGTKVSKNSLSKKFFGFIGIVICNEVLKITDAMEPPFCRKY